MWKRTSGLAAQIGVLWALSEIGQLLASRLRLPVPGNVLGMCLLFGLLCTGRVPERLFERGAGLLARHFALFFVPVAVGLMGLGQVLGQHGLAILVVLVVSTAVGLSVSGVVAQALAPVQEPRPSPPQARALALGAADPLPSGPVVEGAASLGPP
jgi:holin-like protein